MILKSKVHDGAFNLKTHLWTGLLQIQRTLQTVLLLKAKKKTAYWINFGSVLYHCLPAALHVCTQCHLDSDAALDPPAVAGRWVTLLRQVSVNQVEDSEAPASISTRISFSIPRIESANLEVSGCRGVVWWVERGGITINKEAQRHNKFMIVILKYTRRKSRQVYRSE